MARMDLSSYKCPLRGKTNSPNEPAFGRTAASWGMIGILRTPASDLGYFSARVSRSYALLTVITPPVISAYVSTRLSAGRKPLYSRVSTHVPAGCVFAVSSKITRSRSVMLLWLFCLPVRGIFKSSAGLLTHKPFCLAARNICSIACCTFFTVSGARPSAELSAS